MAIKSIESPLAEITLRRYEKPYRLSKRDMVQKLCLSLGILQPGDSRDVIVDVLYVLLDASSRREMLSSIEVRTRVVDFRRQMGLKLVGVADSNIRRQLLRLRDIFLVEKVKNEYRILEHERLKNLFAEKIEAFYLPSILARVKEYIYEVDKVFAEQN
ncbi:MAG: hypothetical protein ACOCWQ_03935 [Nanoarchaeota archaeon]